MTVGAPATTDSKIYWGATMNGATYNQGLPPFDMTSVNTFEAHAGKPISLLQWGQDWYNSVSWPAGATNTVPGYPPGYYPFLAQIMDNVRNHGSIPLLTWMPEDGDMRGVSTQPKFALSTIINGTHDAYIRKWASDAKAWGHPFMLRFAHEMNGDWSSWAEGVNGNKAGEYVLAWRHVHDIFAEVGATNVTWVWCANVAYGGAVPVSINSSQYPGDDYVDWTSLDGYNWGDSGHSYAWQSFDTVYRDSYTTLTTAIAPTKPVIIAEVASNETSGNKAAWITDFLSVQLPQRYPKIRAFLWFNIDQFNDGSGSGARFKIEDSATSQAAFAQSISDQRYLGNEMGSLPALTKIQPW